MDTIDDEVVFAPTITCAPALMTTEKYEARIIKIREILQPIMPYGIGEAIALSQARSEGRYDELIRDAYVKIGPILQDALQTYEEF